jgi:hypothetical protein
MAKLFNRAKMTTATTGSGTVTLGSASNGFQTFAAAGVSNGDVVQYVIEEGANFEIGTGTYSSTGTSLTRSPTESSNSDNAITLAGQATVSITAVADDLNRLQHGGSDKVTVSSTGASVAGNLAVSGTVDGRDVASDGSKLDGIESGATGDQTNAEIRAAVEAASDSNVFTDADHTKLNGIEANAKNDQTITAGGGLTGGGTGDVTISHSDTSSQASVNGSGRTYIQDITLDTYGHVTGLATATETVVNTDTNTIPNNATITLSAGGALTGGGNFTTDQSSNETITFNHSDTSSQGSVNNSGRTYIQDITLDGYGHITGINSATETVTNTNTNQLTTFQVEDGDGTEVTISHGKEWKFTEAGGININWTDTSTGSDGDPFDLSFNVSTSITAGSGLTGGGALSSNRTISHADTSSQSSVNNSGRTYIQDITLDTYGHITGITSATETVTNTNTNQLTTFVVEDGDGTEVTISQGKEWKFVEGGGIDINWTDTSTGSDGDPFDLTIKHVDTSSQGSVNNSGNTVIQDVTLDTYGHVTGLTSKSLSIPSAANNATITLSAGTGLSGGGNFTTNQSSAETITFNLEAPYTYIDTATGNYGTVKVDDDRGVTWAGYAIRDDWVFMSNGANEAGIYNDTDNEWAITCSRNSHTILYHNGSESLRTIGITGIRVGAPSSNSSDIYMSDSNEGERRIHCNSNRIGFLNSSNGWGAYCEDAGHWVVAGNITASGNVNSQSDVRVKENIEPILDAMQKVQSINGVTFNRNDLDDTETRYVGVIAQDVEAVLPEAVSENGEGIKQVAYGNMVGLLIEAIKEQQTQIDDLKAEIQSMKS